MARSEKWCPYCHGSGQQTCSRCGGRGEVRGNVNWDRFYTCSECGGSGTVECSNCFGRGWFEVDEDD